MAEQPVPEHSSSADTYPPPVHGLNVGVTVVVTSEQGQITRVKQRVLPMLQAPSTRQKYSTRSQDAAQPFINSQTCSMLCSVRAKTHSHVA